MQGRKHSFSYENPLISRFGEEYFKERIPRRPGVYFMLDGSGEILYIGKANSLRARLRQYAAAKPGTAPERILEMIESVRKIRWERCGDERSALARESELLHAIRPPFNIAGTESAHYLFIGVRSERDAADGSGFITLDFQLSSREEIRRDGYRVYGCFKNRPRTKAGYTALLRLIHASVHGGPRFSYPARICRSSPPWLYTARFPAAWQKALDDFLSGRNPELLHLVLERLLANEELPPFTYPSIQEDIEIVRGFHEIGPRATQELRSRHGLRTRLVSHRRMDDMIRETVRQG